MRAADISTAVTAAAVSPGTGSAAGTAAGAKVAHEPVAPASVEKPAQVPAPQDMNAAVRAAAQQIDSYLKSVGREVEFRVDEETGMTVVTVRATATGDVIRQIPNEEVLQLARRFRSGSGAVLDLVV
ncbi:MAG TPA: flagellar protein FlaG [Povalibacter sp.]|nr:flagellar protein FlaG [Povalibacter sp.]